MRADCSAVTAAPSPSSSVSSAASVSGWVIVVTSPRVA
jgi:hypothetical protein